MRVDREDVDELQRGEDVGCSKQALRVDCSEEDGGEVTLHLRDECWVPGIPLLPGQAHGVDAP